MIGEKNWISVGGEDTGERSAVIYAIIESARRHRLSPMPTSMLERLPGMMAGELDALMPETWQPASQAVAGAQVAD